MGRLRRFTREFESLVLQLRTEEAKLQNVYEKLLRDIVPDHQIEPMLKDPFGPLWREPATIMGIRRRLWRHPKLFEEIVHRMNQAMEEMKQRLGIGTNGRIIGMEATAMKKQFRRVMFVLQQHEYHDSLKILREGVSSLEDLLSGNMELEPSRYRGSRIAWYGKLRDISMSIYEALRFTLTCACPGPHEFGLRLISKPVIITPHDDEHEIVKSQTFHLILSTFSTTLASDANLWTASKIWNMLSLSVSTSTSYDTPLATATNTSSTSARVRFSLPTPAGSDTSEARDRLAETIGLGIAPTPEGPSIIQNLCRAVRKSGKQGAGGCCGRIYDKSSPHQPRSFEVYPLGSPHDNGTDWSPVSLGSTLSNLLERDKLQLAWIITSSVLQLDGTPWLSGGLSNENIFLGQQNGVLCTQDIFVMKSPPEKPTLVTYQKTSMTHNPNSNPATLKALGLLLVELILGQSIESLRSKVQHSTASIFSRCGGPTHVPSDYETALALLDQINTRVGSNYCAAVKRCINCEYYQEVEGFSQKRPQDPLIGVLSLIEQDIEAVMS
ncbi:hypothetical protein OQA88_6 [Cercophora sp. LCS_1]